MLVARVISQQKSKDLLRFLYEKIDDIQNIDAVKLWYIARLISLGIFEGEVETLFQVTKRFDIGNFATMQFANSLLALAYEARHLTAGLHLADHFWRGVGVLQSRELSISIYQDIAQHQSAILPVEAIDRLSQHCILQAHQCYEDYLEMLDQIQTLKSVPVTTESKSTIHSIKSAVGTFSYGFLSKNNFQPNEKCKELEEKAQVTLEQALHHLNYILEIDITKRPELKNHLGCLTAHMMLFQIVTEQHEAIPKSQAIKASARSLLLAWHYDTLPGAVDELKSYLKSYKDMSKGSMEIIIRSTRLDLITKHRPHFFTMKSTSDQNESINSNDNESKILRSSSLPNVKLLCKN